MCEAMGCRNSLQGRLANQAGHSELLQTINRSFLTLGVKLWNLLSLVGAGDVCLLIETSPTGNGGLRSAEPGFQRNVQISGESTEYFRKNKLVKQDSPHPDRI